ncbi:MAG: aminoacyl-tRNA deacylase [Deltaproteobacteria bacterium]|jgi:Cys-tRNA(Pro)/Cys-tRNA(Cys) deacylase|nr:aminoacyl-tRNA deacylase [Deltaproteobacteria bacterium]
MGQKTLKKTQAARRLESLGLTYELVPYEPGPLLSAVEAADSLNLPQDIVYKTLLLRGDRHGLLEACLPAAEELDLKALAKATGDKSVALTTVKELTALTGYLRGGCSPLGGLKDFPVYLDEAIMTKDKIAINAGARGLMFLLRPQDLLRATQGILAPIAKKPLNK